MADQISTSPKGYCEEKDKGDQLSPDHDIRHFFTTFLEEGGYLRVVAELAGHNVGTMLKSYQHLAQRLRKKTITQLPGLGKTVLPKSEK